MMETDDYLDRRRGYGHTDGYVHKRKVHMDARLLTLPLRRRLPLGRENGVLLVDSDLLSLLLS
jgi:hypothetical protein